MRLTPVSQGTVTPRTNTEAANTAVAITLAANADEYHVLHAIQYSYTAAPTNGGITVTIGGTTVFDFDIVGTEDTIEFPKPIYQNKNEAMVITLKAGGAAIVGSLNVQTS